MRLTMLLRQLEEESGGQLSLEALHPAFEQVPELKLAPDQYLHHAPFCRSRKLGRDYAVCVANKRRSLELAARGRSFGGRCPFGIAELAQPVRWRGRLAAVLYLGGLEPRRGLPPEARERLRFAAEFIRRELALHAPGDTPAADRRSGYLERSRIYLERHYSENIGLAELARELGVNPNYLGALLKHESGAGFRERLTERRLREARLLLRLHRHWSIREVAQRCGFADSNYFSAVFRRRTGVSPTEFRRAGGESATAGPAGDRFDESHSN